MRMGIYTGEASERDGVYAGPVPNRAARIMAAGHGGQILVGAPTAALLDDAELVDLGEHRLPDLAGVEHVFQIRADDAGVAFPALRTVDVCRGNMTTPTTALVGRAFELAEAVELVRTHRLVTLTGVGGVGKTRLALVVGAGLADEFPDGVWLVELAPVADADSVPDAFATALGITPAPMCRSPRPWPTRSPAVDSWWSSTTASTSSTRLRPTVDVITSRADTVTVLATSARVCTPPAST